MKRGGSEYYISNISKVETVFLSTRKIVFRLLGSNCMYNVRGFTSRLHISYRRIKFIWSICWQVLITIPTKGLFPCFDDSFSLHISCFTQESHKYDQYFQVQSWPWTVERWLDFGQLSWPPPLTPPLNIDMRFIFCTSRAPSSSSCLTLFTDITIQVPQLPLLNQTLKSVQRT